MNIMKISSFIGSNCDDGDQYEDFYIKCPDNSDLNKSFIKWFRKKYKDKNSDIYILENNMCKYSFLNIEKL